MFKNLFNLSLSQITSQNSQTELIKLQEKLATRDEKANNIQKKFDFCIPDYIIDEIIEMQDSKNFINLHYLINCAVVNEKISENNARLIKQVYCFNNIT